MVLNNLLLPPVYFGNISYFACLANAEQCFIDIDHRYEKQTYRNRCEILGANRMIACTVPVHKPSGSRSIMSEIMIHNAEDWPREHQRTIESSYRSAPYFDYYADKIFACLEPTQSFLYQYDIKITKRLIEILGLNKTIKFNSTGKNENGYIDLLHSFSPKNNNHLFEHFPEYDQVFEDRHPFHADLSILDLLFNKGPESLSYLKSLE